MIRNNKENFLKSLKMHDEIKLSTFSSKPQIVQKHIILASCCFEMGLHDEGIYRINKANTIGGNAEIIKQVKKSLGEDYLEKMAEKGLEGSNEEELDSLKKLCENLSMEKMRKMLGNHL